jgi:parallel beta-helix repeat protein
VVNKKNVWKMVGVLFLCLIFIFCSIVTGFNNKLNRQSIILSGDIFYVGGSESNNYTKIQDAIDNASGGDTVFVFDEASPYHENVVVDKSLFLIGEDKDRVVIDAGSYGDKAAVTITADDVFVSGFKMICFHDYPNQWDSELVDILSVKNITIRDNIIQQNKIEFGSDRGGIILRNSLYCFIQNNTIIKEKETCPCYGVVLMLGSAFINVSGNEVYNYTGGIYLRSCSNNIFYMNYLHNNMEGLQINSGYNNTIINNVINLNTGEGIRMDGGYNTIISGNIITDNGNGNDIDRGIGIIGGSDNFISQNNISNNNPSGIDIISINNIITNNYISNNNIGVYCDTGYNNHIEKNNFINNKKNGYFEVGILFSRNFWDENYWNKPRAMPYPIFGKIIGLFNTFRWVNFDWHPAQEPYNI